jgi:hypothetical protein
MTLTQIGSTQDAHYGTNAFKVNAAANLTINKLAAVVAAATPAAAAVQHLLNSCVLTLH